MRRNLTIAGFGCITLKQVKNECESSVSREVEKHPARWKKKTHMMMITPKLGASLMSTINQTKS